MDPKIFLEEQSLNNFPSGLGGCKGENQSFECCEYNITIFSSCSAFVYIVVLNIVLYCKK